MRLLFAFLFSLSFSPVFTQATFQWAKQFGGGVNTFATAIATDPSGNVISTGYFDTITDFDPGIATFLLSAVGELDAFVSKLDQNGNLLWVNQLNFPVTGSGEAIASDGLGNIYVAGSVGPPPSGEDIFIAKYSPAGALLWQKQIGSSLTDLGKSLRIDQSGNVYVSGVFTGIVDFDPGLGTFTMNSGVGTENFILKLNTSGNFVWAKHVASTSIAKQPIAVDNVGDVYYTGEFVGVTDFDPNIGTYTLNPVGNTDMFICKLNSAGSFVWAIQIGGSSFDRGTAIVTNNSGDIFVAGHYFGIADLDPSAATYTMNQAVNGNGLIMKMNTSGVMTWVEAFGAGSGVGLFNLATDNSGGVYSIGSLTGTSDLDPGTGSYTITSFGSSDIFISKLDAAGNFSWVKQIGGLGLEYEGGICVDGAYNVYTNGGFQQTCDFDPSLTFNLTASSFNADAFVHKLSQTISSGIYENNAPINTHLFPNPCSDFINISGLWFDKPTDIRILNSLGQEIMNMPFYSKVNVSLLTPGMYTVKISSGKFCSAIKFIKQ
jgi:hypothetical protein